MSIDREAIYSALFALSAGVTWGSNETFVTRTRRLVLFSDVPGNQQPWFGQAEHAETISQRTALPYKHVLGASWVVYHRAADEPGAIPATTNNQIIQALEKALEPTVYDPGFVEQRNTLQGLVHHCFIDGAVIRDPGDIDMQGLIVVPIKILVP
jgi:hypothetical protein